MDSKTNYKIHRALLVWYRQNARSLPWRNTDDPYLIWISEVMLQQTRVETVIPYFENWLQVFPDVFSLSSATEEMILKQWEGLGYYRRARNIKKTADIIVNDWGGNLPETPEDLRRLPGIGEYSSAAIASIAFGKNTPALEANGIRVVARLFNFQEEISRAQSKKTLRNYLLRIVEPGDAGNLNQAVMDLGATLCLPKKPKCTACPLNDQCLAYQNKSQETLPVNKTKDPIPHLAVVAAVNTTGDKVLITKRLPDKLLGGLWEYPGGKVEEGESHQVALARELREELGIEASIADQMGVYDHAYTHFSVTVFAYYTQILSGNLQKIEVADYQWVDIGALDHFPMGKVDRMISRDLLAEIEKHNDI